MDVLTHRDLGSWELDSANFDETKIGRGSGTHLVISFTENVFPMPVHSTLKIQRGFKWGTKGL